jgi:hypothetical protein
MSILTDVILRGTRGAQPAAGDVSTGSLYCVTDEAVVERSNGSAWQAFSPGALLAYTSYNPGTATTTSTTSTTGADVDATNLSVTFTVPSTGRVVVVLSALAYTVGASDNYWWNLRTTAPANVAGTQRIITNANTWMAAHTHRCVITGLTPGASVTYRWGHGVATGTGNIRYGSNGSNLFGQALMEVWVAP